MSERITGPFSGYYIATYACAMGELGDTFIGYVRLCSERPRSFWQAVAVFETTLECAYSTEDEAHRAAHDEALAHLGAL